MAKSLGGVPTAYDFESHFDAKSSEVDFIQGSLEEPIKSDDQSYDAVFCWDIIEHIENDKQLWSELNRVLKPGGKLYVSVPHKDDTLLANCYLTYGHHTDKTHKREYLPSDFQQIANDYNWTILETHLKGGDAYPYLLLNFIPNKLVKLMTKIYIKLLMKLGLIQLNNCHGDVYVIYQK
jgi:SAM-dependent methyltransferase